MKEEPLHSIKRQHIIQLVYYSKEESEQVTFEEWSLLFDQYPFIKELYEIIHNFKKLFKKHDSEGLAKWLQYVEQLPYGELLGFAVGIKKDLEAVTMAVLSDYNNSLAEGLINKVKESCMVVVLSIFYGTKSSYWRDFILSTNLGKNQNYCKIQFL